MNEVVAIVEGETEQAFVRDQLAEHLGARGIVIWAVLPGRTRRQGGIKEWTVAKQDIIRSLREGRYCTTMFDYYRLPESWPGRAAAKSLPWQQRSDHVEKELLTDVTASMGNGFNPRMFIPYIQLHEFEALAFADAGELAAVTAPLTRTTVQRLEAVFQRIVDEAGDPEAINDNYETCPSRRIRAHVRAYRKRAHGPIVTRRIGLDALYQRCRHFASWIDRLAAIAGSPVEFTDQ